MRSQTTSASEALAELPPKLCDEVVSLPSTEAECPVSAYNEWDLLEVIYTVHVVVCFIEGKSTWKQHMLNLVRMPG